MDDTFDLDAALASLAGIRRVLVCPHDDPDPDALAAAWGMERLLTRELGAEVTIAFEGIIGRAENRAMVRELGIKLRRLESLKPRAYDGVVLVDTQPAASNHSAPRDIPVLACIDHHPWVGCSRGLAWSDVRPDGETTTSIVLGYLLRRRIDVDPLLATAVLYALKTDTRDFTREASERDVEAYAHANARADLHALGRIVNPLLERRHYQHARWALETARVHGPAVVAHLPALPYPDLVAEMADYFVRRRGTDWCLCAGVYKGSLRFSLRTEIPDGRAGQLAVALVRARGGSAGGHGMTAGGRIALIDEGDASLEAGLFDELSAAFLDAVGAGDEPIEPLCRPLDATD